MYGTRYAAALVLVLTGCVATPDGDPTSQDIGSVQDSQIVLNQIVLNQIVLNQIVLNQIVLNQLAFQRVGSVVTLTEASHDLETTADGRKVLEYIAKCSLRATDTLRFEYDSVTYEYPGALALAPDWETRGLTDQERGLVSACLIATVNAFGKSVQISARAYGHVSADDAERAEYPVLEGAFFGDVFGDEGLKAYSCQGSEQDIARAHSEARLDRVCAESPSVCEVTYVGRCRDVCDRFHPDHGWSKCWADGVRHDETISVYLRADDPDGENLDCSGAGSCSARAETGTASIVDCDRTGDCRLSCGDDGYCTFSARSAGSVRVKGRPGSKMEVDCSKSGSCGVDCEDNSTCEIACDRAGSCDDTRCRAGASCVLYCSGAGSCRFDECAAGGEASCDNDVKVCGRPCP